MTARAEGGKHAHEAECVGLAERLPKWNPRYVAYALSQGATDILAFREAQPNSAGFIAWLGEQRETWRISERVKSPHLTRDQERAFNRWLESRCEPQETR